MGRELDQVVVTLVSQGQCLTSNSSGSAPPRETSQETAPAQVIQHHRVVVRLLHGLKHLIRFFVKVLYLFPLLLLAKLVLLLLDHRAGDMITVAFVGLVVLFFSVLALLMLLYAVAGPPSRRTPVPRLRLPEAYDLGAALERAGYQPLEDTAPHLLAERCEPEAEEGEPIRVRGRVVGNTDQGEGDVVLRDCWLGLDGQVARVLVGSNFAVVRAGHPPVVVALDRAIHLVLVGPFRDTGGAAFAHLPAQDRWLKARAGGLTTEAVDSGGQQCTLHVGDVVELVAGRYSPIRSMDDYTASGQRLALGSGARDPKNPYRGDTPTRGLEVGSDEGAPMIICKR